MLIRSQNKKYLVSTNNIIFYVMDSEVICFGISGIEDSDYIILGHYETETKVMKVLDMIQEAYTGCIAINSISAGLTANEMLSIDISENKEELTKMTEAIKRVNIFQMPEDSEVEI